VERNLRLGADLCIYQDIKILGVATESIQLFQITSHFLTTWLATFFRVFPSGTVAVNGRIPRRTGLDLEFVFSTKHFQCLKSNKCRFQQVNLEERIPEPAL
jgi:hypothetical protein